MTFAVWEKGKMMSDYIKREDALEQFDYYDLGEYLTTQIRGMLMDIPSADVAPVVRCKDCKGSEVFQNDSSGVMARYCKAFTLKRMVADDDFCSYGERKDNE